MPPAAALLVPLLFSAAWLPHPAAADSPEVPAAAAVQQQSILTKHNTFRAWHSAAPLAWDPALERSAAAFVAQCQFRVEAGLTVGQNLGASGTRDPTGLVEAMTQMWYDSGKSYDWAHPGFQMASGPFTQLVWRATAHVGCALQYCSNIAGFGPGTLVSCRYSPPGNVYGGFPENVLPRSSK